MRFASVFEQSIQEKTGEFGSAGTTAISLFQVRLWWQHKFRKLTNAIIQEEKTGAESPKQAATFFFNFADFRLLKIPPSVPKGIISAIIHTSGKSSGLLASEKTESNYGLLHSKSPLEDLGVLFHF